jgi:hypothetical protein
VVWSEGLYRIAGREASSPVISYKDYSQLYTPESWLQLNAAVQQALSDGTPYEIELEMVRPDGSTCWVIARAEALFDHDGRVIKLRGTVQDITERKRAETTSSHLAAIIESSDDAIVSKRPARHHQELEHGGHTDVRLRPRRGDRPLHPDFAGRSTDAHRIDMLIWQLLGVSIRSKQKPSHDGFCFADLYTRSSVSLLPTALRSACLARRSCLSLSFRITMLLIFMRDQQGLDLPQQIFCPNWFHQQRLGACGPPVGAKRRVGGQDGSRRIVLLEPRRPKDLVSRPVVLHLHIRDYHVIRTTREFLNAFAGGTGSVHIKVMHFENCFQGEQNSNFVID